MQVADPRQGPEDYPRGVTRILPTLVEARAALAEARSRNQRVVLVPTMGALHAGHESLVRLARQHGDLVVVSIFVNPLQFGPGEDFERYPRDLEADTAALERVGADMMFTPTADEMYPAGRGGTTVTGGPAARGFEGAHRPGHFDGVLTVVSKLFHIVQPDLAIFGEKDAQQVFLVRRMVSDLNMPVEIITAPLVRESDGLALSSRNRYLTPGDRQTALALSQSLAAARDALATGGGPTAARDTARALLEGTPGLSLEYFDIVREANFAPVDDGWDGDARGIVAARVGTTRLIDTMAMRVGGPLPTT